MHHKTFPESMTLMGKERESWMSKDVASQVTSSKQPFPSGQPIGLSKEQWTIKKISQRGKDIQW